MARLLVFFRALGHSTSSFGAPKAPGVWLPLLRGHREKEEGGSESSASVTGAVCCVDSLLPDVCDYVSN